MCCAVFESLVLHSAGIKHVLEPDPSDSGAQQKHQQVRATTNEPCPKCKHPELEYYTMQ